jgi:hypothetical protein
MAVALLQHCPGARFSLERTAHGIQFTVSHTNVSFFVINRQEYGKDKLPELFRSGKYRGYSIYFMNNLQSAYPRIAIPKEYTILSSHE